jgi:hypothetical protein
MIVIDHAGQAPEEIQPMKRWYFAAAMLVLFAGQSVHADFDAAGDFSAVNNPNGVWSYGYTTTLGGTLNLYTTSFSGRPGNSALIGWLGNQGIGGEPLVQKNGLTTENVRGTVDLLPGQLSLHPGPTGDQSVVRWTAPTTGSITVDATFEGRDTLGTSTDVHVLDNGAALFNGEVTGFGASSDQSTSLILSVHAGDTIDFVVGYGTNHTYFNDTTALSAYIKAVPEPSALALFGVGAVGLIGRRLRRARASH